MKIDYINTKKILKSKVNNQIFPYLKIDNFLNKNIIRNILINFPKLKINGSIHISNLNLDIHHKKLINELKSDEFKKIISNKFNINLNDSYCFITYRFASSKNDGKIHVDSKDKIMTILLYLNSDSNISNLRLLKDNSNINNYFDEIPSSVNSGIIFKVTDNCWHGYVPYIGQRFLIQINFIDGYYNYKKYIIRHSLSYFIKSYNLISLSLIIIFLLFYFKMY